MEDKIIFIIIILICIISIYIFANGSETFDTNLFFQPIPNIFLANNYYNYELNRPNIKQDTKSLNKIQFNSFLYSKPTSQKIICSSHKNMADCWEDNENNCQWVHKNPQGNFIRGSYCDVGANIWP